MCVGLKGAVWQSEIVCCLLFHSQFTSLVAGQKVDWTLRDHVLSCQLENTKLNVRVISEELAYNCRLKQYRMFIVDRPLVAGITPKSAEGRDGGLASREKLLTRCVTLDDHKKLLCSFSRHSEVSIRRSVVMAFEYQGKVCVCGCFHVCR